MTSPRPARVGTPIREAGTDLVLLLAIGLYLLTYLDPRLVLAPTTITGGDTPSHVHPAHHLAEVLLPGGRVIGWTMGNYAGYPLFQYYFPFPFLLIALLGQLVPFEVAFKIVTVVGPLTLPYAVFHLFRSLAYPFPVPAVAASLVLPFLLQEGNSMWGGNVPSMLAGEFCHNLGLSLAVFSLGSLARGLRTGRGWAGAGLLLAACGLSHTFAFLFAALGSLGLLLEGRSFGRSLGFLVKAYVLAFCLMGFWAIPLVAKMGFATSWVWIWQIQSLSELLPTALVPLLVLALLDLLVTRGGLRGPAASHARGFLILALGSGVLYVGAPALGLVDIRFVPGVQLVLAFLAADLLAMVLPRVPLRAVSAASILAGSILWTDANVTYIRNWVRWNYEGFERKAAWPIFRDLNAFLRGSFADPRVAFEFSPRTNMFGSVRAFETIPHFAHRQTLEATLIHSAINAPFIYYLQGEVSEQGTNPIPGYSYSGFDLPRATAHLRLFNVSEFIAVSETVTRAMQASPDYALVFERGPYKVFRLVPHAPGYVVVPRYRPVLFETDDWRRDFYRWYRRPDLLEVPLVPTQLVDAAGQERFDLRAGSFAELDLQPVERDCAIQEEIGHDSLRFQTSCPGLPHLVRISYFPNWRVEGAERIYPVAPAFMLVFPDDREVRIRYGWTRSDVLGSLLSVGALLVGVGVPASARLRSLRRERGAGAGAASAAAMAAGRGARSGPLLGWLERQRRGALVLLVLSGAVLVGAGAYVRVERGRPERLYQRAWEAYEAGRLEEALRGYRELIELGVDSYVVPPAYVQAAFAHLQQNEPRRAADLLEELIEKFPDSPMLAEALYHLGTAYAQMGEAERAAAQWRALVERYPGGRWSQFAADRLAELAPRAAAPGRPVDSPGEAPSGE